jgi:hypothetical protein
MSEAERCGVRRGLVIAFSISLTLAIVFSVMDFVHIDMQRISPRTPY